MIRFAVFGSPIKHSLSPLIHGQFARQAGLKLEYLRILSSAEELPERFREFLGQGGAGANFTLPLKEVAGQLADDVEPVALATGATNTLFQRGTQWVATNTDGQGLVADLLKHRVQLRNARILMVGAGGAARGVIPALLAQHPALIHVVNRTPERAERLVSDAFEFQPKAPLSAGALTTMANEEFSVIINATSSGLQQERPQLRASLLKVRPFCYDMVYGDHLTPFLTWAQGHQCQVADGLGMLVGQAAESFRRWTEVSPDPAPVLRQLRKQLSRSASQGKGK
ncbi:MAG: shikimate dehydrogenase AroE [Idiomarinaceae bacterium HL-53]|nr:MAG: shikimate dehydrogenase AroE [Idiomarinaceae bacterium HL-53]CUS47781.1 shikimate dehydrogenase [Idiomarinaceae bacterium HL-53]